MYLGIDIGSISVKTALLNEAGEILDTNYIRHNGQPLKTLQNILSRFQLHQIRAAGITGYSCDILKDILGIVTVNEIVAQAVAVSHFYPEVKTIIEIGGQDSKFILLASEKNSSVPVIEDFAMNTLCAGGTGSFLDQQASRLQISIEELGQLAQRAKSVPRIAGRCSVFAKSDMIHLQQKATPLEDILAGLCFAVARNFKSNIARRKNFPKPVVFSGGVAANSGMVRAFKEILELKDPELIVPQKHSEMGAIGVAFLLLQKNVSTSLNLKNLDEFISQKKESSEGLPQLRIPSGVNCRKYIQNISVVKPEENFGKIPSYLGVDVGSISTNIVIMDENKNILAKRYLMTQGRPVEVVRAGLKDIGNELKDRVIIKGVCTTGSGRYMIADLIGADIVKNEITAQARAAVEIDPQVDTIFEIGGQDSKFISLKDGKVVDFEMNKVCAAGTGSFLEEQAQRLGISIKEEFAEMALSSQSPVKLGERCTVFMETDLIAHQQKGQTTKDLASGLAYSIVYNYLNRVVGNKKIGEKIFFQGGVAFNKAVISAFEMVTNKRITVPPHHEVTGAIGCCLIAKENVKAQTRFKGFDIADRSYSISSFECKSCTNHCQINKVTLEGEQPIFYGGRCEKYEIKKKSDRKLENLFAHRKKLLSECYVTKKPAENLARLGIPYALPFHELYPFFSAFFGELGLDVILSDETNKSIIHQGVETVPAETCYPVKVAFGHIVELLKKDVKYIFLPSIIQMKGQKKDGHSYVCPYVQSIPYTVKSIFDFKKYGVELLSPVLDFTEDKKKLADVLFSVAKKFTTDRKKINQAIKSAFEAQERFYEKTKEKGLEILSSLKDKALVIIGRPYNSCDSGINLEIPEKLLEMGVMAIPMDYLPTGSITLSDEWENMFWRFGQKVLAAAEFIKNEPNLYPVYLTNFGCGPDSFILHFFAKQLGEKPFLQIEIDEHSADAGVITRLEAFLDSIENQISQHTSLNSQRLSARSCHNPVAQIRNRTLYIPYMSDHSYIVASAFKSCKIDACVIENTDEKTVELGRKYTLGKECYPCIITVGDMLKLVMSNDFDRKTSAFFMPSATGPCRFGQYCALDRLILDKLGFSDVPVYAPQQDKNLYKEVGALGSDLTKLAWQGIVAVDLMNKLRLQIRPYECEKGLTDRVYKKSLDEICVGIVQRENLTDILKKSIENFRKIPTKKIKLPKVGIVGEIFIRSNDFSNSYLIKQLEELECECSVATCGEWLLYTNWTRNIDAIKNSDYATYIRTFIEEIYQKYIERKFYRISEKFLQIDRETETKELLENASAYMDKSFIGEAILSVGKSIDYIKNGCSGVINVMPFTCMPGTITSAILKKVKEDFGNIPIINISYDGISDANTRVRLEAFVYQVKQFHSKEAFLVNPANF